MRERKDLDGRQQMKKYRAYMVGPDGHVRERDLRCSDEVEAFELVSQLVNGQDVALWQPQAAVVDAQD
jgi:hypothetical protein